MTGDPSVVSTPTSTPSSSAPSSGLLSSIFNTGLGAFQTTVAADVSKQNAKTNALLAAQNSANTTRYIIFGVIGVVVLAVIVLVLKRK